jgi:nucleotide-binding universal stress UspA family protein
MYARILLAYDGTREGRAALREGALLARRCGAEVHLLSVVPNDQGVQFAESVQGGPVERLQDTYKAILKEGLDRLVALGFTPKARLVIGDPAEQIGAFAREIGADLVVVGHRKQKPIQRWWSGSSGAYLVDHLGCSLLIGRNTISDEAFEAEMGAAEGPPSPSTSSG